VLALVGTLVIVRRLGGTIDALGGVAPAEQQDRAATAAADPAMSSSSPPGQPAEALGEPA